MELSETEIATLMQDGFIERATDSENFDPSQKNQRYTISIGQPVNFSFIRLLQQCSGLLEQACAAMDQATCQPDNEMNAPATFNNLLAQYHALLGCLPDFSRVAVGLPVAQIGSKLGPANRRNPQHQTAPAGK